MFPITFDPFPTVRVAKSPLPADAALVLDEQGRVIGVVGDHPAELSGRQETLRGDCWQEASGAA